MAQNWLRANICGVVMAALLPLGAAAGELRLMMVEQIGCHWCAQWHSEIGPIYPKTDEGRAAPLFMHNIRDRLPEGITVASPPQFTPTFILLEDNTEIGRISGYPGEDFFWGLLGVMLAKAKLAQPEPVTQ